MMENIILMAVSTVMAIIGYLLMRSVNRMDADLKDQKTESLEHKRVQADHSAMLKHLEHVPDAIADHSVRISLIENSNEGFKMYLDEKFTNIERTLVRIEKRIEDNENFKR